MEKAKLAQPLTSDSQEPDLSVAMKVIRNPRAAKGGVSNNFEDRSREEGDPSRTTFAVLGVVEVAAKLPVMVDKATLGTKKVTSVMLLMAVVETASMTLLVAVEIAIATFPSAIKVATRGGGNLRVTIVGASTWEITGSARRWKEKLQRARAQKREKEHQ